MPDIQRARDVMATALKVIETLGCEITDAMYGHRIFDIDDIEISESTEIEMRTMEIKVTKLHEDAKLPTRKHPTDAGMDVYALASTRIPANQIQVVRTGITIAWPVGYVWQVWPKGRSDHLIGAGIGDEQYQGEVLIKIVNAGDGDLIIRAGDAIAQIVLVPVLCPTIVESKDCHYGRDARTNDGIVNQI